MKTLLITAFAAVFALQVHGQNIFGDNSKYLSDPNESKNNKEGFGAYDLAYVNRLNSMPVIDSISFIDVLYPKQSFCQHFEYNNNGRIAKITKGAKKSSANESIVIVYDGDFIKSIISNFSTTSTESIVFEYNDAGKLIRQKFSDRINGTYVTLFNSDGTVKQETFYDDMLSTEPRTSTAYLNYDTQGRIKAFAHEAQDLNIAGNTEYLGDFIIIYASTVDKYEYTEPTDSYSFLVQVQNSVEKDSVRFTRNNISIDTCIIDTLFIKNTYKDGTLIAREGYLTINYLQDSTCSFKIAYKADSVDGLVTKRYTVNQETKEEQLIARYVYENHNLVQVETDFLVSKIYYAPEPKAKSVQIKGNQVVTVEFNTALDPAIDYAALLTLNNTQLKAETLSISKAYISAGNAKQLVIELSRPIAIGESFEITAAEPLPLKDGRTAAFAAVVKAQTVTDVTSATTKEILISQTSAGISITAGAEIVSVKVFTASGVLAQSLQPASNEATISTENLPAGVYQVFVTDADGNSASQTVSF